MKLMELMKEVEKFLSTYAVTGSDKEKMKSDLLDLVQKAVDHGEGKDQNKLTGIISGVVKNFFGGKKE